MLTGFKETHLQIKKSVPAEPKRYALFKRREAPHFLGGVNVKYFLKKGEEKIKMKSQKPHKHRLRDSERLY